MHDMVLLSLKYLPLILTHPHTILEFKQKMKKWENKYFVIEMDRDIHMGCQNRSLSAVCETTQYPMFLAS